MSPSVCTQVAGCARHRSCALERQAVLAREPADPLAGDPDDQPAQAGRYRTPRPLAGPADRLLGDLDPAMALGHRRLPMLADRLQDACGRPPGWPSAVRRAPPSFARMRACARAEGHLGHFVTLGDSFFATDRGSPRGSPIPLSMSATWKELRRTVPLGLHGGHSVLNGSPSSSLPSPVQTPRRTRATMASHRCHWLGRQASQDLGRSRGARRRRGGRVG